MLKELIIGTISATLLSSIPVSSQAAGIRPPSRTPDKCTQYISVRVSTAQVGQPARPIPRFVRGRATRAIRQAVTDGLTQDQAFSQFMTDLSRISNYWWRRDLANAAAGLVEAAGRQDVCD